MGNLFYILLKETINLKTKNTYIKVALNLIFNTKILLN